jgi:hypothetical protein
LGWGEREGRDGHGKGEKGTVREGGKGQGDLGGTFPEALEEFSLRLCWEGGRGGEDET